MADVRLSIAGREYIVTCKDGEEARLNALGRMVDEKAREAGGSGGLNESRLLLFASLLLADQVYDAQPSGAKPANTLSNEDVEMLASTVERLADRLESILEGLERSD
jgi:cell division protein ZapA